MSNNMRDRFVSSNFDEVDMVLDTDRRFDEAIAAADAGEYDLIEAIVKDSSLQTEDKVLAEYVEEIKKTANSENGNKFFVEEENIYKMLGVGNVDAGKAYYLNQDAVRNYVMENYK